MFRSFTFALMVLMFVHSLSAAADEPTPLDPSQATVDAKDGTLWYDARLLTIEGLGWSDTKSAYDRLPAKAEKSVRKVVWNLSRDASGIVARFVSDANKIRARWTLTDSKLALPHMAATGASGLDLYVRDEKGTWRWLACGKPTAQTNTADLAAGIPAGTREYMLYLPLYNGVKSVEIGVAKDQMIAPGPARSPEKQKPIVFYGTSITHGACASRPGMTHVAILGRRFDRPVVNLGFSGNGDMETEVAELMIEIDAAVYVVDCLPNIGAKEILARTKPCIEILRKARPTTPILLVEDRSYGDSHLIPSKRNRNLSSRKALRKVFDELIAAGNENLYYLEGEGLLGDDNEGTVDSSHPNDLGFMRQADGFAKALGPLLNSHSR